MYIVRRLREWTVRSGLAVAANRTKSARQATLRPHCPPLFSKLSSHLGPIDADVEAASLGGSQKDHVQYCSG